MIVFVFMEELYNTKLQDPWWWLHLKHSEQLKLEQQLLFRPLKESSSLCFNQAVLSHPGVPKMPVVGFYLKKVKWQICSPIQINCLALFLYLHTWISKTNESHILCEYFKCDIQIKQLENLWLGLRLELYRWTTALRTSRFWNWLIIIKSISLRVTCLCAGSKANHRFIWMPLLSLL